MYPISSSHPVSSLHPGSAFPFGIVDLIQMFWPPIVLLLAVVLIQVAANQAQRRRLRKAGMGHIDRMDGITFEKRLQELFRDSGYSVRQTPPWGDFDGDLLLEKRGVRTVVQAKRWNRRVGVTAIQEVVAARGYYRCTAAMVVTNSRFTQGARHLARANDVVLWDRDRLAQAILDTRAAPDRRTITDRDRKTPAAGSERTASAAAMQPSEKSKEAATAAVAEADPEAEAAAYAAPVPRRPCDEEAPPRCAICEAPVSEGVRRFCLGQPERFKGQVFCMKHQRPG
jgi:restriction system protein